MLKRQRILLTGVSMLLVFMVLAGCTAYTQSDTRPPVIKAFNSSPAEITAGEVSTIQWEVSGTATVTIDPGVGRVDSVGTARVSPTADTVYKLSASNSAGVISRTVLVMVSAAAAPRAQKPPATEVLPPASAAQPQMQTPQLSSPVVQQPVITLFTASPDTVTAGTCSALNWMVSGATAVTISNGVGVVPALGSAPACPGATTTYILDASNSAGSVQRTVTIYVSAPAPPPTPTLPVINSFTANPASVTAGSCSNLSWSTTGATSATVTPGGAQPVNGNTPVCPAGTTTYTLTVTNAAGSVTGTVTVLVTGAPPPPPLPVINSFTANPASVAAGSCSNLSWSTTGATSAAVTPGGAQPVNGNTSTCPAGTTIYTLTATNATGSVTGTVTVTVTGVPPPTLPVINSFTANPASVAAGSCSNLSWSTTGATSATVTPGGAQPVNGNTSACPAGTITYTLTATNAAGSVTGTVTVTVTGVPPPSTATTCEQALFDAVNTLRAADGKAALTRNAYIDGLCRQHAQSMVNRNHLDHLNFLDRATSITANVPGTGPCAENVQQNNMPCNASDMANLWFNSTTGHKENMLNAAYNVSGMGIVIDGMGQIWACQLFAGP